MDQGFDIPFKLHAISTVQFALFDKTTVDIASLTIETSLSFGLDRDRDLISVASRFNFESKAQPLILIEVNCDFSIKSQAFEKFQTKPNEITVPKALMSHLSVITIGTTRGALHAKTEGTPFNKFHIPTIDVTELIPNDVVFYQEDNEFVSN